MQEKVEVIDCKIKNPATALRQIADKFQCGRMQIQSIVYDQQNLLDKFTASGNTASKRVRTCRFQNIDLAMLEWFRKARSHCKNIPVSGPTLQQKACAVAAQMGTEQEFKASNGWPEKIKIRYNIKGITVSGESEEVREETVQSRKERLPVIFTGYSPQDILNMDEIGKFYRALPNKSLSEAAKQCRGGKQSKERITWAFFVNAAGGKEKPTVIGKSANPHCFKGIKDLSNLPCTYFHRKKAWIDFDILDQVFTRLNQGVSLKVEVSSCYSTMHLFTHTT